MKKNNFILINNSSLKFVLLSFFLITCFIANAKITVIKVDAGPNGYSYVKELHDGGDHSLVCRGPGYDQCGWMNPPSVIGGSGTIYDINFLVSLAEDQIALGNNSGTIIHNGEIQIVWLPEPGGHKFEVTVL